LKTSKRWNAFWESLTALTPENNYLCRTVIRWYKINEGFCFILKTFQKIAIVLILQLFCINQNSSAQDTHSVVKPGKNNLSEQDTLTVLDPGKKKSSTQDTISSEEPVKHKFSPDPMKSTLMAITFPGLGQIYNRKYWKVPIVYAGFGTLIYTTSINSKNYNLFMQYYRDFTDDLPGTDSYTKVITSDPSTYDKVDNPEAYASYKEKLLRYVDYYKQYRDLSYIGLAGWYLLSVLDANVDANLFNYDISDNLDIAVFPFPLSSPGGYMVAGLNLTLKVNF
jgi:hypothetical protein